MSHSIREFCERLATIEKGKIMVTWTSTLRNPYNDGIPVLTVTGELLDDKFIFDEETPCYGLLYKFEDMADDEVVTSFRLARSLDAGIKVFVESLL